MLSMASKHLCYRRLQFSTCSAILKKSSFSTKADDARVNSRWSDSPSFLGQYVPRDNGNIKVVLVNPRKDEAVWDEYKEKLDTAYSKHGMDAETRQLNDAPDIMIVALASSLESDEMIGGIRIEGPFSKPEEICGMRMIENMSNYQQMIDRVEKFCFADKNSVVMEAQGPWANETETSTSLARALCNLHWFINSTFVAGSAGLFPSDLYGRNGFNCGPWFETENPHSNRLLGDERYDSCHMMTPHYMSLLNPKTRQMVRYEQRVLAHAKERYWNQNFGQSGDNTSLQAWCPEILLNDDPRLAELRNDPSIEMMDHLPSQYQELAHDRLPNVQDPELLNEPPHWVYLPWRKNCLQLLGPKGYHVLRTDRNRYKMTEEETQALTFKSVGVIGMSVGHSSAMSIAQEGLCGHMKLADYDILELPNLNRIPSSIVELGQNKTLMTARRLAEIDPYLPVEVYTEGVNQENIEEFMTNTDCVVEECDSLDIKVLARFEAAKQKIPLIMETSDYGKLDVERFDVEPRRAPFHGLAGNSLVPHELKGLSTDDKAPFVLDILELEKLSPRLVASFMEVDRTISSWPQLARDVALGGALVATAVHKLFSDPENLPSGRSRTNLNDALANLKDPLEEKNAQTDRQHSPTFSIRPPLPDDPLETLYVGAGCAPSGGNMQPWVFSHDEEHFHISAYTSGPPIGMDIECRGTAVACGAALANAAALAALKYGVADPIVWNGDFDRIEERLAAGEKVHIGSVRLAPKKMTEGSHNQWSELGAFVNDRVTNRQKGLATPLFDNQVRALKDIVSSYGDLYYMPVNHSNYETVLKGWEKAERVRLLDSRLHRELFEEFVWPERGDNLQQGIDMETLELTEKMKRMIRVLERVDSLELLSQWDLGGRLGDEVRKNLLACAGIVTIGVKGNGTFEDHLRGGVALERMWLKATALGLGLQPWSPVFGYAKSKETLSQIIGSSKAATLYPSAQAALDAIGLKQGVDHYVLSLRIHTGPPASAISQRRHPSMIQASIL